jgi:hypothetical protein
VGRNPTVAPEQRPRLQAASDLARALTVLHMGLSVLETLPAVGGREEDVQTLLRTLNAAAQRAARAGAHLAASGDNAQG